MAELKTESVMVNLEPTIYQPFSMLIATEGLSASAFCRRLIIKELKERGLITDSHLASMAQR